MLVAVVFIAGCPWRCTYCHNPHLQQRQKIKPWAEVLDFLGQRRGLLDGVVFSGGEPLSEEMLPAMMARVRDMGFKVGLHTAGIYPRQLQSVLSLVDWVGLDIKTDKAGYAALTGRRFSATSAAVSLELLLAAKLPFECRTTWSPDWLSESALIDLAQLLAGQGVENYAVQAYRAPDQLLSMVNLSKPAQSRLHGLFPTFTWR